MTLHKLFTLLVVIASLADCASVSESNAVGETKLLRPEVRRLLDPSMLCDPITKTVPAAQVTSLQAGVPMQGSVGFADFVYYSIMPQNATTGVLTGVEIFCTSERVNGWAGFAQLFLSESGLPTLKDHSAAGFSYNVTTQVGSD